MIVLCIIGMVLSLTIVGLSIAMLCEAFKLEGKE